MAIADIDQQAVLRAIAEFDELGREGFLLKYGFKPARHCFIEYGGKRYDSKAIAGVAVQLPGICQQRYTADYAGSRER